MKFYIRDVMWAAAVVALISAWQVNAQRQRAQVDSLQVRVEKLTGRVAADKQAMAQQQSMAEQSAKQARQTLQDQHQEILSMRQLLKESIKDQRDWFELELGSNRILAITPATTDSARITVETIRHAEKATGLDGERLRHFIEPIHQLRPKN
jgi:hypothetical protein